jgi:hypothetical protein
MKREIAEELAFNFRAHGHYGRGDRVHLTPAQARMVARTAARTPEVMVKVLSAGATSAKAVQRHIDYVSRKGGVELHTDDGDIIGGKGSTSSLAEDWNLDLEEVGAGSALGSIRRKTHPRLVHKLMFSMPPGTNPEKVLSAVQTFCREEFALKRRYVMALHTDEPHPHVHVVVKAMGDDGRRLNVKKATLKEWRVKFADHLRSEGVAANATPRPFRKQAVSPVPSTVHWLKQRERAGESRLATGHQHAGGPGVAPSRQMNPCAASRT